MRKLNYIKLQGNSNVMFTAATIHVSLQFLFPELSTDACFIECAFYFKMQFFYEFILPHKSRDKITKNNMEEYSIARALVH